MRSEKKARSIQVLDENLVLDEISGGAMNLMLVVDEIDRARGFWTKLVGLWMMLMLMGFEEDDGEMDGVVDVDEGFVDGFEEDE